MKNAQITFTTGSRRGLFDLTRECANFVNGEGDGLLNVFVPHATAGVVIMELGAGSDEDLMSGWTSCCRAMTAGATRTGHAATAPTTYCRCSCHRRSSYPSSADSSSSEPGSRSPLLIRTRTTRPER